MNAKDFIINNLKEISDKIPEVNIRYAYDKSTEFHIIEVSPESIRRGNDCYMEIERDLWREFYDNFPDEDILISDVDETNNMENMLYIYKNTSATFSSDIYEVIPFRFNDNEVFDVKNNYNLNFAA